MQAEAASMPSKARHIQSLFAQLSGLMGLVVFLNQAWAYAPLERTILTAFGAGLAVYLVLVLSYALAQRILAYDPPDPKAETTAEDTDAADSEAATRPEGRARKTPKASQHEASDPGRPPAPPTKPANQASAAEAPTAPQTA